MCIECALYELGSVGPPLVEDVAVGALSLGGCNQVRDLICESVSYWE